MKSDVIVECHGFVNLAITADIVEAFRGTHSIEVIDSVEKGGAPDEINCFSANVQKMLMDEERKFPACWLVRRSLVYSRKHNG